MKFFIYTFTLFFSLAFQNLLAADTLEIQHGAKQVKFSVKELKAKLQVKSIKISDPVYGVDKSFDGFLLTDILTLAGVDIKNGDEIIFTAKDGYAPNTTMAKVRQYTAYVVFQESGTNLHFGKVAQGKAMVSPAPFYLVWSEGKSLGEEVPWPYQIIKIETVDFKSKYPNLYPAKIKFDSNIEKGFSIFKNQCLRCHSINLEGGDLGPELNIPKNITEYWTQSMLKSFIQNPLAFRSKSKMPPFSHLKDEEIDHVLVYITFMKDHKVKH